MAIVKKTTRDFIFDSFVDLLKTTDFEDLTVTAICRNCEIERQHFYYYFKDKFDLAFSYFIESWSKIMEKGLDEQASYRTILEMTYDNVYSYKSIYKRLTKYRGQGSIFKQMMDHVYSSTVSFVNTRNEGTQLCGREIEQLKFYCYGVTGMLLVWYMNNMEEPAENLVKLSYDNIPENLKQYFY